MLDLGEKKTLTHWNDTMCSKWKMLYNNPGIWTCVDVSVFRKKVRWKLDGFESRPCLYSFMTRSTLIQYFVCRSSHQGRYCCLEADGLWDMSRECRGSHGEFAELISFCCYLFSCLMTKCIPAQVICSRRVLLSC